MPSRIEATIASAAQTSVIVIAVLAAW